MELSEQHTQEYWTLLSVSHSMLLDALKTIYKMEVLPLPVQGLLDITLKQAAENIDSIDRTDAS